MWNPLLRLPVVLEIWETSRSSGPEASLTRHIPLTPTCAGPGAVNSPGGPPPDSCLPPSWPWV